MAEPQAPEKRLDIRAAVSRQARVLGRLAVLAGGPPQSLVLEGGTTEERQGVARWWAALLNCERPASLSSSPGAGSGPCLSCTACRQVEDNSFSDLLIMDEAYYEDGKSRLSVDAVRAVRPVWGQPPSGEGFRVTIFPDVRDLSGEVSNALLKSLEEPRPGNVFVLLTPQRERLLPTLVSRSWVFTLAWPEAAEPDPEAEPLAKHLVAYWRTGRGWYDQTQAKIPAPQALGLVNYLMACQRDALIGQTGQTGQTGQAGKAGGATGAVSTALGELFDPKGLRRLDLALTRAQEALSLSPSPVNPSLVLDWLAAAVRP